MPVDQFDLNLSGLSHSEYIFTLGNFADLLLAHPFFRDNWPSFVPHPMKLKEQLNAYHEAVNLTEADGGHTNIKNRDDRRKDSHVSAVLMGQYVVMRSISENDPSFLHSVGLKLKTRSTVTKSAVADLVAPLTVTVKHGKVTGTVIVSYSRVPGAGTYEIQMCEGQPDEGSYVTVGHFTKCRIEVTGLEPGKKIYFRVRCLGTGAPGPFSNPVSIIVL